MSTSPKFINSKKFYRTAINQNIGKDGYTGWIDLFGCGTGDNPTKYSKEDTDYATFNDWGNNSALKASLDTGWRTLSSDEWEYLVGTNSNRNGKGGMATVNGVNGFVLLPGVWALPSGCSFTAGCGSAYTTNTYNVEQWRSMKSAGAVFLPAAGYRYDQSVFSNMTRGYYWSSTFLFSINQGCCMLCSGGNVSTYYQRCYNGFSMRLVKDC